jgi:hypothetical protein
MEECKSCHRKTGLGKPKKDIPPVAGQYGSYLFNQMKRFQKKERHHDDDPDDETFDELADSDLDNLVTFIPGLPPHGPIDDARPFGLGTSKTASMNGMIAMAPPKGTLVSMQGGEATGPAAKIAGRFKILPTGDILLSPINQDMRQVTGLTGNFKVTADGILFMPD